MARLEQYKDDLLAACLHLVLSSPAALTDSDSIIAPIQLALKLGLGYFPLASVGLDAIERWIGRIDHDHDGWFGKVLPCLNEYLLVQVPNSGDGEVTDGSTAKSKQKLLARQNNRYKAVVLTASFAVGPQHAIPRPLLVLMLWKNKKPTTEEFISHGH